MDTNIDTLKNSNHNTTNRINPLHDILQQHISIYNITQHNNKPTHYPLHKTPSCIDYIFSNVPNKIINTTTTKNPDSDHSYLTTTYMTNEQIYTPKFIKIRDKRHLTKDNLNLAINLNKNFYKI